MLSTTSKQNNDTNKLPKVLVLSLSSYDIISGGNEIHPIVFLTLVLYTTSGWCDKRRAEQQKLLLSFKIKGNRSIGDTLTTLVS